MHCQLYLNCLSVSPDSTSFKSLLVDNILLNNTRVIQVDIQRLVYDMIARLYQQTTYGQQSMCSWSSATHPAMVFNFVRTRDYYLEALPKCYVQITLSHVISPSALKITAMINWQPPAVEFLALPISLSPGEEYVITPEYIGQTLGCSVFPMCTTDVEFSVSSNRLPVRWDPALRCFRAPVPNVCTVGTLSVEDVDRKSARGRQFLLEMYGASPKVSSAETTFTANIVMDFPDNVRFERTTRYNIKLAITDPEVIRSPPHFPPIQEPCWPLSHTNKRPTTSLSHSPPHPQRNMVECLEKHKRPREDRLDLFCTDATTAKNKRKASEQFPTRTMFEKVNAFEENSRFALDKFEHTDLELATKRQKMGKRADSGVQMNLDSFDNDTTSVSADDDIWMGENLGNFTTKCSGNATANGALPTCETGSKFTPSLRKKSSVRRVVFPRSATSTRPNVPTNLKRVDSAAPVSLVINHSFFSAHSLIFICRISPQWLPIVKCALWTNPLFNRIIWGFFVAVSTRRSSLSVAVAATRNMRLSEFSWQVTTVAWEKSGIQRLKMAKVLTWWTTRWSAEEGRKRLFGLLKPA